jgi:hypothetical protein
VAKRGARLWLKASVCGHTVPVYYCLPGHPFLVTGGSENSGTYDPTANRVAISSAQTADSACETLLHELLHAFLYLSGVSHTFLKGNDKLEEDIIRTLSPHLFAGLRSSGMLKIPRPPKLKV